jgi:Transposase
MSDVVRLIRRHFDGIVAWTQTCQTNGFIEAINGLIQASKRKALGYARLKPCERSCSHRRQTRLLRLQLACPLKTVTHSVFKRALVFMVWLGSR